MCADVQILSLHKTQDNSVIILQHFKLLGLGSTVCQMQHLKEWDQRGRRCQQCFPREAVFQQLEQYRFSLICIFINLRDQVKNTSSILVRVPTRNRWAFESSKASSGCFMVSNIFLKFKSTFSINNCLCNIPKARFQLRTRLRKLFICRIS